MILLAGGFNAGGTGPCYVFASWVAADRGGGTTFAMRRRGTGLRKWFQGVDGRAKSTPCPERVCGQVSGGRESEYLMLLG